MPDIQSMEFNALPEAMRQRFLASIHSNDREVAPLVRQIVSDRSFFVKMAAGAGFAALILLIVAMIGFGDIESSIGLWHGNGVGAIYIVCAVLFFLCILLALRRAGQKRGLPYLPGKYLHAFSLAEAGLAMITLYDLTQASGIKSTPVRDGEGRYKGTRFVFFFANGRKPDIVESDFERAKELGAELARRQGLVQQAAASGDKAMLYRHDPFNELRIGKFAPGKIVPGKFMAKPPSELLRWSPFLALALGLVCGIGIWFARNIASDEAAYRDAKAGHKEAQYADYVRNGHRHVQEMQDALPHVALDEARQTRSVTKIRAVLRRYPDAGIDDEVKAEVHKIYAAAMERFAGQAANADPALVPFVQSLLGSLEESGNPTVQVRFSRPTADDLAAMDAKSGRVAAAQGKKMVSAATWFANDNVAERENRILDGLQQGFGAIFSNDVLRVATPAKPDPNQPMMDIAYQISGSGNYYVITHENNDGTSKPANDNRLFVGLICKFDVNVALANQPPGWHFDLSVLPPEHFHISDVHATPDSSGLVTDAHFYHVMAEFAFDELRGKMRNVLFRRGTDAYAKIGGSRQR
jgi:hypothetical protein